MRGAGRPACVGGANRSEWEIFTHGGRNPTGLDAVEFAVRSVERGAGELLVTSMDRDGTKKGFDLELTRTIADAVHVPVVASGGVGSLDDLVAGVKEGHASAVLAASIFHFGTFTIAEAKALPAGSRHPDAERTDPVLGRTRMTFSLEAAQRPRRRPAPRPRPSESYTAKLSARRHRPLRPKVRRGGRRSRDRRRDARPQGGLVGEAADVLYHLLVLLKAAAIPLDEVMAELERRTSAIGLGGEGLAKDPPVMARDKLDLNPYHRFTKARMGARIATASR